MSRRFQYRLGPRVFREAAEIFFREVDDENGPVSERPLRLHRLRLGRQSRVRLGIGLRIRNRGRRRLRSTGAYADDGFRSSDEMAIDGVE